MEAGAALVDAAAEGAALIAVLGAADIAGASTDTPADSSGATEVSAGFWQAAAPKARAPKTKAKANFL